MPIFGSVIPQQFFIDPIGTYGCAFDHRVVFDGATTGGSGIVTSASLAGFTSQDVGKRIVLTGAGTSGAQYAGTITSLNSSLSVNVTPNTSTTVSGVGLQIHTDDLAAWTALISDLNSSPYPGGVVHIRNAGTAVGFTNRSGISSFLPVINKQVRFEGIAGGHTADTGDYTAIGGSCIAYCGVSTAPSAFGAVMTIAPTLGATAQALKQVNVSHLWIDCRNGDQNAALKGLSLQSCHGFHLDDFFVMDAAACAVEFTVVAPGVAAPAAGSLGEAKDCTRGLVTNCSVRALELPHAGAQTTAVTTTTAVTLSNGTPQSLGGLGANTLPVSGYAWVMTNTGYPVLVSYTGGGGGATLTGCTVSPTDSIDLPATISGCNVVQAVPANACAYMLSGDQGANTCFVTFESCQVSHGTSWGPAAIELRNSDSNLMIQMIVNGGNNTNDGVINRIRKPGVRINGSNSSATMAARNNLFIDGSAGGNPSGTPPGANYGGVCNMGLAGNGTTRLLAQAGPTYWERYQMANGEPIPIVEGNSFFQWYANGGFGPGDAPSAPVSVGAVQTIAATTAIVTGSLIAIPPQGLQIGTTFRWRIPVIKTAAGTTAGSFVAIKLGTTGTTADTTISTGPSTTPTAAVDSGILDINWTITAIGGSGAGVGWVHFIRTGTTTGFANAILQLTVMTPTTFNTTTAQQFLSVAVTARTGESINIDPPVVIEVLKPANP